VKIKNKTQLVVIEQLHKTPIVQFACEKSGISRATYYRWRKDTKKFKEATDKAIEQGRFLINDLAESKLISAMKDGNITAIIYWLKSNSSNYSTKIEVNANHRIVDGKLSKEQEALIKKAIGLMSLDNNKLIKLEEVSNKNISKK